MYTYTHTRTYILTNLLTHLLTYTYDYMTYPPPPPSPLHPLLALCCPSPLLLSSLDLPSENDNYNKETGKQKQRRTEKQQTKKTTKHTYPGFPSGIIR